MSVSIHAQDELFKTICNKQIGSGMSRKVYDSKVMPDHVIKIEEEGRHFQNNLEWTVWQRIEWGDTQISKWFAPCDWISPCGTILIQKKTTPAIKYPKQVPVFLCDFKKSNYGMYNNKFVCHDYGLDYILEKGLSTKRMKKVREWYAD